ncbi:MAG TPA: 3-dehydroquinate synthase [Chryseosolibacter sp.]
MPDNLVFATDPSIPLRNFLEKKNYSRVSVLTDENTLKHCYPLIAPALAEHKMISILSGEEHKSIDTCVKIWDAMTDHALDRHSVLIVLGGGVLGDMGGFCAATFKRGIDFVLIPTTLLSQVDASIGGKLGVDFNHFKNHIGVFQTPALTVLHAGFLKTLSSREKRSGFAEIIKHCLISDKRMWEVVRSRAFENQDWDELIRHSVSFKERVVTEDPREKGLRKILNMGHTIGHAIETFLLNSGNKVLHGQAIAAGLITESWLSKERGLISADDFNRIKDYILSVFGKITIASNDDEAIAVLTLQDKKNQGSKILSVLLDGVGNARWDCEITKEEVKSALSIYRSL